MSDLYTLLDCVVTEVSVPKTVEDGQGAPFQIVFEQIRTAFTEEVEAPDSGLTATKNAGSKASAYSEDYPAEQQTELLRSMLGEGAGRAGLVNWGS
jgi:hypothetical protein